MDRYAPVWWPLPSCRRDRYDTYYLTIAALSTMDGDIFGLPEEKDEFERLIKEFVDELPLMPREEQESLLCEGDPELQSLADKAQAWEANGKPEPPPPREPLFLAASPRERKAMCCKQLILRKPPLFLFERSAYTVGPPRILLFWAPW